MITKRIIPCLDVKNGRVVKGVASHHHHPPLSLLLLQIDLWVELLLSRRCPLTHRHLCP